MSLPREINFFYTVRRLIFLILQFSVVFASNAVWFTTDEAELVADTEFLLYVRKPVTRRFDNISNLHRGGSLWCSIDVIIVSKPTTTVATTKEIIHSIGYDHGILQRWWFCSFYVNSHSSFQALSVVKYLLCCRHCWNLKCLFGEVIVIHFNTAVFAHLFEIVKDFLAFSSLLIGSERPSSWSQKRSEEFHAEDTLVPTTESRHQSFSELYFVLIVQFCSLSVEVIFDTLKPTWNIFSIDLSCFPASSGHFECAIFWYASFAWHMLWFAEFNCCWRTFICSYICWNWDTGGSLVFG